MIFKMLIYFNLMIVNKQVEDCYIIPPDNDVMYCYNIPYKEYLKDYLLEITLVNYYKIKDNR